MLTIVVGAVISAIIIVLAISFAIPEPKSSVAKPLDVTVLAKDSAKVKPGQSTTLGLTVLVGPDEASPIRLDFQIVTNNESSYSIADGLAVTHEKDKQIVKMGPTEMTLTIKADSTVKQGIYFIRVVASDDKARSASWHFPLHVS